MTEEPGNKCCDLEVWPLYDGRDITIAFVERPADNEQKDLLIVSLCRAEVLALIDILNSAIKCESDRPTYALKTIMVRPQ